METLTQKKFSISHQQKEFLKNYRKWGFSDQSGIVREALDRFMKELTIKKRKDLMAQKAQELLPDYTEYEEFIAFTGLDREDFL